MILQRLALERGALVFAIQVRQSDIERAEKLLGITTSSVFPTAQRQRDVDDALRQALVVGLAELERQKSTESLPILIMRP